MGWFNWTVLAEDIADKDEGKPSTGHYEQHHARTETGATNNQARSAWHQARVDASASGDLNERVENKNKQNKPWWK
jgi:hypothetical protein